MRTPILETERLILRPLCLGDAREIYRNWTSDPEVAEFMIWSPHKSVEDTEWWLGMVEKLIDTDENYDWGFVRKSDSMLIGSGGIYYSDEKEMFTLGYNLMKACWRQGYATEAAGRIMRFAVEELHQTKLCSEHAKENPNSGRVMEKVGFHYWKDTEYTCTDGRVFPAKAYLFEGRAEDGDKEI